MANAVVGLDERRLAGDHAQHIAFGADGSASLTADAMSDINVWMLAARTFREDRALRRGVTDLFLSCQLPPDIKQEGHGKYDCIKAEK